MPTNPTIFEKRRLAGGKYNEKPGYCVVRPAGSHDWLLIYTLAGMGQIGSDIHCRPLRPHDVTLVAPGAPHRYQVDGNAGRWKFLWVHFVAKDEWRPWLRWPQAFPGIGHVHIDPPPIRRRVIQRLVEVLAVLNARNFHREPLALNALESALLWCAEHLLTTRPGAVDPRISSAVEYICQRMDQRITIAQLARHCHLSESRLAHLFRQQLQLSPMRFLERQRIERARQLLELSDLPIHLVARRIGIAEPFYFSRRFKRATGFSPRAYRQYFIRQIASEKAATSQDRDGSSDHL